MKTQNSSKAVTVEQLSKEQMKSIIGSTCSVVFAPADDDDSSIIPINSTVGAWTGRLSNL